MHTLVCHLEMTCRDMRHILAVTLVIMDEHTEAHIIIVVYDPTSYFCMAARPEADARR